MTSFWWKETKIFLSKASFFVLIASIINYLVLFLLNSLSNNFLLSFFDINVFLVIIVITGTLYILTKE
ncbi:MAG: hypothetical protein COY66_00320 [Candidatus Kerfeldbacteria bacterium CG_4_10_14_0_8_um_filter_42_10]|uniref:Uncharacterized protein n=1 Tax=Candidatus Kerfeldbacteria bacterium CG_4_10_14_0_8_um_filter_42_10 TaxID=2014248 RepID=A0A2M7RKQ5_9BACT|nr:MAG: hypothetical protein COY66_00320 [Candidatus Kerfeldbacteria bacterium CG_4_10_14_0_8_um_filter_42_10]